MYGYNAAPQVTFAKRPVKAESIYTKMKYVSPLEKRFGVKGQSVTFTPA